MVKAMKKNNEILNLITKLALSIIIAFLFAVKYKAQLIATLSEAVYFQLLVLTTIISSYIAAYLSSAIYLLHVYVRRKCSNEYNLAYITEKAKIFDTNSDRISDENKQKINEILQHDLQQEMQINALYNELQQTKRDKKN